MLHYVTTGSPDGLPVLFLHGFMGSSRDWTSIIEAMPRSARCIAVDLPGHGASTDLDRDAYTMEAAAEGIAQVLDEMGIEETNIVGYSMGGRTALNFAHRHPSRVRRCVLESASPGLKTKEKRASRREVDAERADRIQEDLDQFLENWYRQPLFASLSRHEGLVDEMVARRSNNKASELVRSLEGMGTGAQPSLWDHLEEWTIPTLALAGALDEKYVDIVEEMETKAPQVQAEIVPEAGHNIHAERQGAFLRRVVQFLPSG